MNARKAESLPHVVRGSMRARVLLALVKGAAHVEVVAKKIDASPLRVSQAAHGLAARGILSGRAGTYRLTDTGHAVAAALLEPVQVYEPPPPDEDEDDLSAGDTATVSALRVVHYALGRGRCNRAELLDVADRSERTFLRLLARIREAGFEVDSTKYGVSISWGQR